MKIKFFGILAAAILVAGLVGCATTEKQPQTEQAKVAESPDDASSKLKGDESVVVDWQGKNFGAEAFPKWLAQAVANNNFSLLKAEVSGSDNRYYFVSAREGAKSQDDGRVLAQMGAAQKLAYEFQQKVISRAGQNLSAHQAQAVEVAAMEAEVDLASNREEIRFWQKIRTLNGMTNSVSETYNFYIVYSIDNEIYDSILKKYLTDIIGKDSLEEEAKVEVGKLWSEMKADREESQKQKTAAEERAYKAKQEQERQQYQLAKEKIRSETATQIASTKADAEVEKARVEAEAYESEQSNLRLLAEAYLQ